MINPKSIPSLVEQLVSARIDFRVEHTDNGVRVLVRLIPNAPEVEVVPTVTVTARSKPTAEEATHVIA